MNTEARLILLWLGVVSLLALSFGGWMLQRKVHYKMSYQSQVEETVREMVKPEALKE